MRISDWSSDVCSSDLGVRLITHAIPCIAAHNDAVLLQASNASMGKHFDRAKQDMCGARSDDFSRDLFMVSAHCALPYSERRVSQKYFGEYPVGQKLIEKASRDRKSKRLNSSQ